MGDLSRDREYEQLERKVGRYGNLLEQVQKEEPFLGRFTSWAEVIAFMREGSSVDPDKDKVLRAIFRAHQEDGDARWRDILLMIFWPGLRSLQGRKRNWDSESTADLWQNVVWVFLQVLCRIDVGKRSHRLVQKVINDTHHYLYREYQLKWNQKKRVLVVDPLQIEEDLGAVEGIDFTRNISDTGQEVELSLLRRYLDEGHLCEELHILRYCVDAGHISEEDMLLIAGTRIYGQSVAEYARDAGLSYEAAKKRRQRAEAAIRNADLDYEFPEETERKHPLYVPPTELLPPFDLLKGKKSYFRKSCEKRRRP